MTGSHHLEQVARHHVWATGRLLGAVTAIPAESYWRDCGLFFGSVHGTLNHLLLTDAHIWYPRVAGGPMTTLPLNAEIESDPNRLSSALVEATGRWAPLIAAMDTATLEGDLHFTMTTGQKRSLPMRIALLHVFNHATHHRGQITAALSMMGFDYPPLDLPFSVFAEQSA